MTDIINSIVVLLNFVIIPGLSYGSQLALGALGVTFVYAILRFANFAHGELMSFGGVSHNIYFAHGRTKVPKQ